MRSGFSLIELVMALFIAGIALAVATPSFIDGEKRLPVDQAADRISGLISAAARRSSTTGDRIVLRVDVQAHRYVMESYRRRGGMQTETNTFELPAGVRLDADNGMRVMTFLPTGSAHGDSLVLHIDTFTVVVAVSPLGEPRVYR